MLRKQIDCIAQVLHFLSGHEELINLILRGSAARSTLNPALLQELALVTSVVSRAATLDVKPDMMDAGIIEMQGMRRNMFRKQTDSFAQVSWPGCRSR